MNEYVEELRRAVAVARSAMTSSLPDFVPQGELALQERVTQAERLLNLVSDRNRSSDRMVALARTLTFIILARVQQGMIVQFGLDVLPFQMSLKIDVSVRQPRFVTLNQKRKGRQHAITPDT